MARVSDFALWSVTGHFSTTNRHAGAVATEQALDSSLGKAGAPEPVARFARINQQGEWKQMDQQAENWKTAMGRIDRILRRCAPVGVAMALVLGGCGGGKDDSPPAMNQPAPDRYCTTVVVAGVMVRAHDQSTGAALKGIAGTASSPTWSETLQPQDWGAEIGTTLSGLWERVGTYTLRVRLDGYADWTGPVQVVKGDAECHVTTVEMDVPMERAARSGYAVDVPH